MQYVNCNTTDDKGCKCLTCNDGYFLKNHQCLKCDDNCKTCNSSSTSCIDCNEGFFLTSDETCISCTENCKICLNETQCLTCIDNYFLLSDKCFQCNVNCKTSNDNCKCDTCEGGYFLSNYQCLECDINCQTCSKHANYCTSCFDGAYLTSSNTCLNCTGLCKTCSSETKCLSCVDNYFLVLDKCYQCNVNCKTSNDRCKCDTCEEGYFLSNYQCFKCNNNCKACFGSAVKCISCFDGSYLTTSNTCTKCIESCKTCVSETKCLSCVDNYFLLSDSCYQCNVNCKISINNCMCILCDIGYYFKNYQCLKCAPNCRTCKNETNYCTSCDTNKCLFENSCHESCDYKEKSKTEINEEEEIKYYDEIIGHINSIFTSEFYNTSYISSGNDEIFELEKIKIILTSATNQKDKENDNITSIDLGQCESVLRNFYNITDDELYIRKIDIIQDNMKIPKIEYSIYSYLNSSHLVQLNLSLCEKSKISLLMPLEITENLETLNTSSDYFNNICYTVISENGADVTVSVRQKEYKEKNRAVCQDGCDLYNYNYTTKKVNCSCYAKESPLSFADMKINKTELYKNFVDIKNIMNINILICYKNLLTKDGIIYNIGSYIIIAIIIFHIICFFIFYIKKFKVLKKRIKDIIFAIKNYKGKDSRKKDKKKQKNKLNNMNQKNNKNKINSNKSKNISKKDGNESNVKLIQLKNCSEEKNRNSIVETENPRNNDILNFVSKNYKKQKSRTRNFPIIQSHRIRNGNKDKFNKNSKKKIKDKKKLRKKIKKILDYIDEEKNDLPYDLAIQLDKRKYCKFYLSLLKTQHEFIFAFFYGKDYNSRIIKIDFFFVCFVIFYTINALFFDDDTMNKIYENKGSFDLELQIPKIVYSSLISIIINKILGLLALSNNAIIKLKENKSKNNANKRKKNLIKNLKIKFTLYFILSFLLLLAFWYYIAMFGVIYKNTQMHLLEDTLISFGLSLLYPFIIYLFPGIFRIFSLSDPRGKRKCLYDFSKTIQML